MIKVVHVTTHLGGGAGIACQRLHLALRQEGIDSKVLTLFYSGSDPHISGIFTSKTFYFLFKLLRKFPIPLNRYLWERLKVKSRRGKYEIFSSPFSFFRIDRHPLVKESDIINLHWVADLVDYPSFFTKIEKAVVWTLHDMNPFMGGFHYLGDLKENPNLSSIENLYQRKKNQLLGNKKNLSFVTLCSWMEEELKKSFVSNRKEIFRIPNPLNDDLFVPEPLPGFEALIEPFKNRIKILFISENVSNKRKGFDILLKSLKFLDQEKYCVIAIGQTFQYKLDGLPVIQAGFINKTQHLAYLFNQSDLFALPSREDNLPNVVAEALICGCPVVAFSVGGLPDMITPGFNGFLTTPFNEQEYANNIESCTRWEPDRNMIKEAARLQYFPKSQAEKYITAYTSTMERE